MTLYLEYLVQGILPTNKEETRKITNQVQELYDHSGNSLSKNHNQVQELFIPLGNYSSKKISKDLG